MCFFFFFSETIVVKVGRRSKLNEYVTLYEYQRCRSSIDLCPSSLRFNIFKLFSLETAGPPCTYMVKTLNNLLVWNQKVDYLETWYAVSANRLLPKDCVHLGPKMAPFEIGLSFHIL